MIINVIHLDIVKIKNIVQKTDSSFNHHQVLNVKIILNAKVIYVLITSVLATIYSLNFLDG